MKTYGFIFARGGSKGLPGKNIKLLGGLPLIAHAIRAGKESDMIDRIIVSTDDHKIAEVAKKYGAEVPFIRPAELARDDSPEWLAWRHAIEQVDDFDIFVSLPCTAPLRNGTDIRKCIETYLEGKCDVVVTARKADRHPSFNMITLGNNGLASIAMPPKTHISRRQDAPVVFDMTTVAYVSSPAFIQSHDALFQGRVAAVEIPLKRAVDIDTELDFAFAEFLLERK
ncbi:MAG: acylneuraminate cytidylyltransferase family protein [Pseudodesulfovibrio sp.]|nr:acylneuraminate cytidylyltransferase family protein [Pseudodesulfovibrio sp.]